MIEHLEILTEQEIHALYGLPQLDDNQRFLFFEMSDQEITAMKRFKTYPSRIYFALQLAFFKAKQQFYIFSLESVATHVDYLRKLYFPQQIILAEGTISKPTRLKQQKVILQLYNYRLSDKNIRNSLRVKAAILAKRFAKPSFIFQQLLRYMEEQRVVYPAYSTLQRLVENILSKERRRLELLLKVHLTDEVRLELELLLTNQHQGMYIFTWLQKEPSNLKYQAMRGQAQRLQMLHPFYQSASKIIPLLDISNDNTRYYSNLATHYTIQSLRRFQGQMVYLFLLCFAYYRTHYINDNLVESFRFYVRKYEVETKQMVRNYFYQYNLNINNQLRKIPSILDFFLDENIADSIPFLVIRKRAFQLLSKKNMELLGNHIRENEEDKMEIRWRNYAQLRRKISYNLRFLFRHLYFQASTPTNAILVAALNMQKLFNKNKTPQQVSMETLPQEFIPKQMKKYILTEQDGTARYEMYLYHTLRNAIESGDIYLSDSVKFKSLEGDLIEKTQWEKHQQKIIQQINLTKLSMPMEDLLEYWQTKINGLYKQVNQAIAEQQNPGVKILGTKPDGSVKWQLVTTNTSVDYNHNLYAQFAPIEITQLMHWVNAQTNFLNTFTPIVEKRNSKKPIQTSIFAALLAFATNHGLTDMAGRSNISYYELSSTAHQFIRLETLQQANKVIVNASAKLPMYKHYTIQQETLHSSSDGQKFATSFETINSRHSSKYFGIEPGVSVNTLMMHGILPANAKVIGANDYEGHYVLDLLYGNLTDLKPKKHSTDTHGTNQVNFALLDFFGYQFSPRYKNFVKESKNIGSFRNPSEHDGSDLIQPKEKFKTQLILDHADNIQRIVASLALKTTSQYNIVRKLSSFNRINKTQQALWEYNNIVKTAFILEYIHSETMRQNTQKVLSRQEGYHRLKRKVFYAHEGKFHVHTQAEQQIWSECARLITNIIIYYNVWLLSELLQQYEEQGNKEQADFIKTVSPIAWRHINIYGTYNFHNRISSSDLAKILKKINIEHLVKKRP